MNNFFLSLSRYPQENENFLTESLVSVLNVLLEKDKSACIDFLNKFCVNDGDSAFSVSENIEVQTQETLTEGIPDIRISGENKVILIEVKRESGLEDDQVKRYLGALQSSQFSEQTRRLIVLTKYPIEWEKYAHHPYKDVRWYHVHEWLTSLKITDPVSKYFVRAFSEFLEVERMAIEQVTWEYINGLVALRNLVQMIESALDAEGIKGKTTLGYGNGGWWGYFINGKSMWCGVRFSDHLKIVFEKLDKSGKVVKDTSICLSFEDSHFFSLDKGAQFETLKKFVRESYQKAKSRQG